MQILIVAIIVVIAAVYLVRRFYRSVKVTETNICGCGCDGCSEPNTCEEPSVTIKESCTVNDEKR